MQKRTGKILKITAAVIAAAAAGFAIYCLVLISSFDDSMRKVYQVPLPQVERSTDRVVLARGKHIAESVAACATSHCHGTDLGGGETMSMGPLGTLSGPNVTMMAMAYSDGELARLIRHGVKKDGRSVRFMPSQDLSWLPDSDVAAVISDIRSVPPVDRPNGEARIGWLAKVLDRRGAFVMDVARRIDHEKREIVPVPQPNPAYGVFLARLCSGCHGQHLSGGPIPGAPPNLPKPLNITPHESGIKGWTQVDFDRLMTEGIRKNGAKLDPFMPYEAFGKMDSIERTALFTYLQTVPPLPYGKR